jgi:hypothetical protein
VARFRLQHKFWLDVTKQADLQIAELIDKLKQDKLFTQTIRDGIRLICDLRAGRLDVLFELFPWVEDYYFQRFSEARPDSDQAIVAQLVKLEQLLVEQGDKPIPSIAATGGNAKPPIPDGKPRTLAAPDRDDDEVALVVNKAASDGKSAQNFLDSAFGLLG